MPALCPIQGWCWCWLRRARAAGLSWSPGFGAADGAGGVTWRSSDASSPAAPADANTPVHCSSPWEPAITANDGCFNGSPDDKHGADPATAARQHRCLPWPAPHMPGREHTALRSLFNLPGAPIHAKSGKASEIFISACCNSANNGYKCQPPSHG